MAVRLDSLSTEWINGEILFAEDLNDTFEEVEDTLSGSIANIPTVHVVALSEVGSPAGGDSLFLGSDDTWRVVGSCNYISGGSVTKMIIPTWTPFFSFEYTSSIYRSHYFDSYAAVYINNVGSVDISTPRYTWYAGSLNTHVENVNPRTCYYTPHAAIIAGSEWKVVVSHKMRIVGATTVGSVWTRFNTLENGCFVQFW